VRLADAQRSDAHSETLPDPPDVSGGIDKAESYSSAKRIRLRADAFTDNRTVWLTERRMKRDMQLIRKILFHLEARTSMKAALTYPINGYDDLAVRYHLLLLAQAKLIDFEPESTNTGRIIRAHVLGLNWNGHEFLDAVRSDKVWRKLLRYAKDKGGALPFDLLKVLAVKLLEQSLSP